MIKASLCLTEEESLLLMSLLEESLSINKREQFFSWLQGSLQSLMPHEVLICGVNIENQSQLHFESFISTRYLNDQHVKSLTSYPDGLVTRMIDAWREVHCPVLVANGLSVKNTGDYRVPFEESKEVLFQSELKNIAAHGVANKEGDVISFFSFSRILLDLSDKQAFVLAILVPHMHNAFLRILNISNSSKSLSTDQGEDKNKMVTSREIEVLQWVRAGKTNSEIASILLISVNTVKNHVHSAILKLGVENRAQAAAMAHKLALVN